MATALAVIDMQMAMAERIAAGRLPVIASAETNMAALVALPRGRGEFIYLIERNAL